jgi:hypothetical protein
MTALENFHKGFWALLFVSILLLSGALVKDLLTPPHLNLETKSSRTPSSLPPVAVPLISKRLKKLDGKVTMHSTTTMDIGCLDTAPKLEELSSPLVRIRGQVCPSLNFENILDIQNETNGFRASFFRLENSNRKFTTDYIHLSPGNNTIVFRYPLQMPPVHTLQLVYNTPSSSPPGVKTTH